MSAVSPIIALSMLLGGVFAENPGVQASARLGNVGVRAGVGYLHYASAVVGPEWTIDVGRGNVQVAALYGLDLTSAGGESLRTHLAMLRVGAVAPLTARWFLTAEVAVARYPLAARANGSAGSRDVPVDGLDGALFLPGIGVGYAFGR